ncbi:uncharacterized protein [Eurosta solidaginis]|uniref:uncharacterized protein n=1 Tax=Eurosta solidaginis TaxID=178769 RepID=UPI003530CB52
MTLSVLTHNCQLILLCLLLVTVNKASASQIKKKDGAIASEDLKTSDAELPYTVDETNPKNPNPIQESVATKKHEGVLNNAVGGKLSANVEPEHNKKLPNSEPVGGTIAPIERWSNTADESQFNLKANYEYGDDELPHSFVTSFYVFLGLSVGAMLFILVKVYRLRLSRAERKYGVHGDRTTQELVPLPVSIEDCNSEDEDQTLFEVNRQQIRIL